MSSFTSKVSLILGFVFSAVFAFALAPNAVTVTLTSSPNFNDDSNSACTGAGPRGAYITFKITNTSGAKLNNLSANLNTLTVASGNIFRLAGGQAATQYIGTLGTTAATNTKYVYWYVEYPCNKNNIACNMTCTVSDNAAGTVSNTATVTTKSAISANAGGLISATTLSPCAVIGQIVSYTVTYSFGGVGTGETFDIQPAGNVGTGGFDASAFQLINARINASDVPGIAVGATDKLYFTATANNTGTGKLVTVTYYFECKKVGIATSAKPYAVQTSGNQIKYTGNYGEIPINVPAATFPLTISKRATPTNPNRGDLVTYTITLRNTTVYATSVSAIKDVLPIGLAFQGYGAASQISATNSVAAPILGATGSMTWRGGGAAAVFPYTHYYIPANDSIVLKYTALVGATVPNDSVLTNTAKAYIGSDSTAVVSAAVCAQCVDTDGDGVPDKIDNSVSVSGTVVRDGNALTDGIISGTGTNVGGALYANLLNSSGVLVQSVLVASNGSYTFTNVAPGSNYSVIIATTNTATTPNLPAGYTNIGEGTTNAGDGTANGSITITIPNYNVTGLLFGIQQAPTANNSNATPQTNPGGTTNVSVPATAFSGSDADGTVTAIFIATFPANATSITINGITYTAATFPTTGITIPTNAAGNPTQTIAIDPIDATTTVGIAYFTIDNTGTRSIASATANIPFTDLTISGTTFHDTNGGTINGTPTNTIGGNTLFANLVNPITHLIIASVAVNADGTYSFGTANGVTANTNYSIEITRTMGTVGAIIPTPVLIDAINTAEGTTAAGDGAADGVTAVSVGTSSITNVNFAIEIPPVANTNSEASRVNPGAGVNVPVLATTFSGSDADGIISNIRISAFPANALNITINGTVYTAATFPTTGIIVPTNAAGNPAQSIEIQPADGAVIVSIPFFTIDNAGVESRKGGSADLPFSRPSTLPVKMISIAGAVENCKVILKWQTATELNTERFEIWRSTTGETFEKVGEVKAAGTTNIAQKYSFEDPKTAHYNYYQVRSVDFDGYTEIFNLGSRVKVKTCFDDATEGVSAIYPNPNSTSELTLRFAVEEVTDVNAQVVIFDLTGKAISTQNISINQGANVSTISLDEVPNGIFFVQINTANWTSKAERLVRMK